MISCFLLVERWDNTHVAYKTRGHLVHDLAHGMRPPVAVVLYQANGKSIGVEVSIKQLRDEAALVRK